MFHALRAAARSSKLSSIKMHLQFVIFMGVCLILLTLTKASIKKIHISGVSDDDAAFADAILGSQSHFSGIRSHNKKRPPKSPRPFTPILEASKSPSTSGHHSAGSKFSVSSPSASPSSLGGTKSPIDYHKGEEAISKLRKEITSLRERFANRQKDWAEVRKKMYNPDLCAKCA